MPRQARHVVVSPHNSSTKSQPNEDNSEKMSRRLQSRTQSSTASPARQINGRPRQQRQPRESLVEEDSVLSESDDSQSIASPYTPRAQVAPPTSNIRNGKQMVQRERLQKAAVQNAARRSLGGKHGQTHTPRQIPLRDDDVPSNLPVVGTALTPASKRPIPILSNFEDWLKLATDNKINATNSWNFALIDYFHEMSLLKDDSGRGINFQKASCTLDGCVKIYVGRVESVGVEAGRLLSGLASSNSDEEPKKKRRRGDDEEDDEEGQEGSGDEDEEGTKKKEKKRKAKSHEATLAPSFANLQLKKLELEFAVDPLFKKASADFDEGGAKGLLLNHLSIDESGRIVFDSTDDAAETNKPSVEENNEQEVETQVEKPPNQSQPSATQDVPFEDNVDIDLASLSSKFFPDLSLLDHLDICPSMRNFKIGDPNAMIPLLSGNTDWKDSAKSKSPEKSQPPPHIPIDSNLADQSGLFLDDDNAGVDFDDDEDAGGFAFDMGEDVGFGQGGEAWAREAAVQSTVRPANADDDDANQDADGDGYALTMQNRYREDVESETMLSFFGKAFNSRAKVGSKAFETLTNWRIAKIQKQQQAEAAPPTRQRKEKDPFEIDFHGPMSDNLKKLLAEPPVSNDKISLPKTQLKTKGRNLLDSHDEVIDVKSMMRLWTKPKCRVIRRRNGPAVVDEGFGGNGREAPRLDNEKIDIEEDEDAPAGDYDANFFADDEPLPFFDGPLPIDDDFDDDEGGEQPGFVDAREMLSPQPEQVDQLQQNLNEVLNNTEHPSDPQEQEQDQYQDQPVGTASQPDVGHLPGSFGSQLVTQAGRRLRPEYVNFARVAKKVDVRALKENMWKGMTTQLDSLSSSTTHTHQQQQQQQQQQQRIPTPPLTDADGDTDMTDSDLNDPHTPPPNLDTDSSQESLKFTHILRSLKTVYPEQQMRDISTSYGFICLLHLANEKGLVLEGGRADGDMDEILVRRDRDVGEGYVGE